MTRSTRSTAPRPVTVRDGQPVTLPLDASIEDLRQLVGDRGRYHLDVIEEIDRGGGSSRPVLPREALHTARAARLPGVDHV